MIGLDLCCVTIYSRIKLQGAHIQTNWIPYVKEKLHGEAKVASCSSTTMTADIPRLCFCHGPALREQENIGP